MRQMDKGPIRQLAYLVEDLERSLHHWTQFTGVGPWTVYRNTSLQGVCRGVTTTVKMHVALSYQGEMQIELIQPLSRSPSPYQHEDGRIRVGMHHIAWISEDIDRDAALAQQRGLEPVFLASNGAVRVAYLESPEEPGLLLELIEATPAVLGGFASGLQASRDWDGRSEILQVFDFDAAGAAS